MDAIRISPEERQAECAERCLEVLCDPERAPAARLGEPGPRDTLHPPVSGP